MNDPWNVAAAHRHDYLTAEELQELGDLLDEWEGTETIAADDELPNSFPCVFSASDVLAKEKTCDVEETALGQSSSAADATMEMSESLGERLDRLLILLNQVGQRELANAIQESRRGLAAEKIQLIVVGERGSGKSTLINALLGQKVLPMSSIPCTPVLTKVHWSTEPRATLYFRQRLPSLDKTSLPSVVQRHIQVAGEADVPPLEVPVDLLGECLGGETRGGTSALRAKTVFRRVEVGWNIALCRNSTAILDTPGLSPGADRVPRLIDGRRRSDVVALVLSCAGIGRPNEVRLLERLTEGLGQNVLLVCNRYDLVPVEERTEFQRYVRRQFGRFLSHTAFGSEGLFFVSAREALEGVISNSSARVAESGLEPLISTLRRALVDERRNTREKQLVRNLSVAVPRINERLSGELMQLKAEYSRIEGDFFGGSGGRTDSTYFN